MGITVQNITGSTAMVIWPKMASCVDSFYSVMYHPNWNSMLSSYSRKSFQKEERVPTTRSSFVVENLAPLTTYIVCVTCQSANPSSDQCRVFNTLEQDLASASNTKKDLALGIWLTSSVLLLIIAAILLYGCLHLLCRRRRERLQGRNGTSEQDHGMAWTKSSPIHIFTGIYMLYTHVYAILRTRSSSALKQFCGNSPTAFCYLHTNTYIQKDTCIHQIEKARSYHGSAPIKPFHPRSLLCTT
uniref:Fibronectin type-III domain-containing protein n=1 Tax=Calidris pygmaea TaxID=425635 RepID=A0A8C3KGA8_9CHAR